MAIVNEKESATVSLAINVRYHRKRLGISQVDLAKIVEVSHPRISEIENGSGNPTLKTMEKIAYALEVTVKDLVKEPTKRALQALK